MADLSTAPPVAAQMNYLGEQAERPFFHTTHRDRSRMLLEPREVTIADARGATGLSFEQEGFMLVSDPLPGGWDLRDQPLRDGAYLVHLRDRIRAATGAARVVSDTSIIRLPDPDSFQVPVLNVHADFTDISARQMLIESWDQGLGETESAADLRQLLADSIDASPGEARYSRVLAINAWRPITDPPHDLPLAVCAKNSIAREDLRVADFREELSADWIYDGELLLCRPNPAHRWYQFSNMRQDELLLFIEHDFNDPAHPPVMHSAFADPHAPPGATGRASVEVRTFAFFE
jgi:hypothetical protein